ncbi:MAG: hypothetical protein PHC97_02165 [Patescibacteria group bacterium]|nr:hypothetical protein [Patescibacteria group bacterium]
MEPCLAIEKAIWRGPWILVLIKKECRDLFQKAYLKIYWGEVLVVAGIAWTFRGPLYNPDKEPQDGIMLDIAEEVSARGIPTRMSVKLGEQELDIPIENDKKKVQTSKPGCQIVSCTQRELHC